MENATKALLIAAAVLVVVLIIGLGLSVFNKASETAEGAGDLSKYEMQQFNEQFTNYNSTNASGSEVNALVRTVFNHNNTQGEVSTCVKVELKDGASTTTVVDKLNSISTLPAKVPTGARYSIECTLDAKSKLVTSILVTNFRINIKE